MTGYRGLRIYARKGNHKLAHAQKRARLEALEYLSELDARLRDQPRGIGVPAVHHVEGLGLHVLDWQLVVLLFGLIHVADPRRTAYHTTTVITATLYSADRAVSRVVGNGRLPAVYNKFKSRAIGSMSKYETANCTMRIVDEDDCTPSINLKREEGCQRDLSALASL